MEKRIWSLFLSVLIISIPFGARLVFAQDGVTSATWQQKFTRLREKMVDEQIKARGIKDDSVLAAMLKVERHKFVPRNLRYLAYEDNPLPIGFGQTISQPYIVALMTEVLELKGNERVLEIGTGSGYQAAILAELVREVYSIEILPELASRAEELLDGLGYKNIKVKRADGYLGWPEFAPFERIIVTCASEEVPGLLIEQLAEGGSMVIPVGDKYQELRLLKKINGRLEQKDIIPVRFVPMTRQD
ncbi:MAG: protein-L-isoaspartate O-methyltransferase [Candidatus Omnitrophota bacterium]|nr:MAG: protein-L-isoaspartate O-methyltransferase [Candidatus Omnitrophota bacterium]